MKKGIGLCVYKNIKPQLKKQGKEKLK